MKKIKGYMQLLLELQTSTDQYKCLCISTAHLTQSDGAILTENAQETTHELDYYDYPMKRHNMLMGRDTGWFIKLYDEWENNEKADHLRGLSLPVMQMLYAAHQGGYRMVEFDCDAAEYDWYCSREEDCHNQPPADCTEDLTAQKTDGQSFTPATTLEDVAKAVLPADLVEVCLPTPAPAKPAPTDAQAHASRPALYPKIKEHLKSRVSPTCFQLDVEQFIQRTLEMYTGEFLILTNQAGANIYTLRPTDNAFQCELVRENANRVSEAAGPTFFLYCRQGVVGGRDFIKVVDRNRAQQIAIAYTKVAASVEAKKRFNNPTSQPPHDKLIHIYSQVLNEYFPEGVPDPVKPTTTGE